ncbi:MAG TPA: FecR domain-containing protein [Polyangiaceae bacterium]|jgi:transmembrane sensor|nr:FecR domain-containing protein [Polyangiaceae bacterium]
MNDSRLPVPVRKTFDDELDDAALGRLWNRVAAARNKKTVPAARTWTAAFVSAIIAAAIALFLARSFATFPLHLASGADVPAHLATGAAIHLSFDDTSTLDASAGTELDLLESSGQAFATAMRGGIATWDVRPGGPRLWRIECGPVTVEVVGTRFTVERQPRFVRVAVARGAVLVRGEPVPDRVVRVAAGEAIVIPLSNAAPRTANIAPSTPPASVMDTPAPSALSPTQLEKSRDNRPPATLAPSRSAATPSQAPSSAPVASVADFSVAEHRPAIAAALSEADKLRRESQYLAAARVLEAVLAEHGSEPGASVAEFSLARLYLDSLGNPALASNHLASAMMRGLPVALADDALARLVEANARAGNLNGARDAAARYRALYPNGRHTSDLDRWVTVFP